MEIALEGHRRDEAGQAAQALTAQSPHHFLAVTANLTLATYDTDQPQALLHLERLLELFPGDLHFQLRRAGLLSVLGRYNERLEILKRVAEQKESDPACWQQYAWELIADARQHPKALYLLRKACRISIDPMLARAYGALARIKSMQRKFDEALQLYHFAVCLEEKDEFIAQDYFYEARAQGKLEEAMQFLRKRFERFGAQSSQSARTLYFALVQQGQYDDAFQVLEQAMKLRPDDGELLTYSAEAHINLGDFTAAEAILQKANGVSKPASRWRSLAYLASSQGDLTLARECYEEVLKIEPTAEDAHRSYCFFLAEKEGREAVLAHLRVATKRFPNHFGLHRLLFDWVLEDGPVARERILKILIEIHPAHALTRIDYAYNLKEQERLDEAEQHLDEAETLEPDNPAVSYGRGLLHKKKLRNDDARYAFRDAIRKSVDHVGAVHELIWMCENLQDRRDAVAFVAEELIRQPTQGAGELALTSAQGGMPPLEFLAIECRIRDAHPNLWGLWQSVTRQTGFCELTDERLVRAQEEVRQFPGVSDLWVELGEVQRVHRNAEAELQAHQRAVELAPYSVHAVRSLMAVHERTGKKSHAKKVMRDAIRRAPLVREFYQEYGDLLCRLTEYDEGIKQLRHALKLDPWFDIAWNSLTNTCMVLGRTAELIELARGLTRSRPGNWRSWFRLALAIQAVPAQANEADEAKRIDDCVDAYREAIKLNPFGYDFHDPRNPAPRDLHDSYAEMLGLAGRYEPALEACNPSAFKGKPPFNLRGRAAWVHAMKSDYDTAKQLMLRVLKENDSYYWGWDRLIEWCQATNDYRAYHDAANTYLRATPHSAFAQAYRGEALIRMEERESGMEDLRASLRRDPCYQRGAFILFEEQLADDDLAGAETTLASIQQNIAGCIYGARPIQFHAKRGDKARALELFKELCFDPFPPPGSLDMAMRALDRADWKSEADEIVREALKIPEWQTELAILYAAWWNPNKANDLPDRIAAIDRALERFPGTFRYLDLKAELLTSGNQFDRAWQTCKEKTFPIDQPYLDGRAAWVRYRSGGQNAAIADMRELVKQNPKYVWGWIQLADWYGQRQQWVDVLTVAEQLVQIAPRDPTGFGYRGQAKENLGDPQAARADYIHAFDLQPTYVWAAWQLFNLYARNAEWQRAEKIMDKAKKHADPGDWALRRVDLLIYQNKKGQFAGEFENLLKKSAKSPWLVDQSLQFIVQAGWWSDAEEVMHRNLDLGPHICDPWVRLRVAMGDRTVGSDVQSMAKSRPERTNCIAAYAIELAYAKDPSGLRRWINTHDDCLREDTPCWSKVGFALSVVEDWAGLIEWMSDWSDHAKALPGMLIPLIKAHRSLGEVEEARKVSLYALTKLNPDYANSFHKVWLMYDSAIAGEVLPVQRYLESSDLGGFDGYHQMISALVRAISMTTTDKENGFGRARRLLADAAQFAPPTVADPALRSAYQEGVAELARLQGSFGAKLWRWWRWLFPRLPAPPKVG
jgi:tetratricopeptide (TPR) repeat protein